MLPVIEDVRSIPMDEDWFEEWEDIPDDQDLFEPVPEEVRDRILPDLLVIPESPERDSPELAEEPQQQQPASKSSEHRDVVMRLSVLSDNNEMSEVEFSIDRADSLSIIEHRQPTVLLSPISMVPPETSDTPQSLVIGDEDSEDEQTANGSRQLKSKSLKKYESLFVYPPPPEKAGIPIHMEDYCCLKRDEFLNDVIIDFYLKYLSHEIMSRDDAEATHIFSSHFFTRLSNPPGCIKNEDPTDKAQRRHAGVSRWTKSINIFEKNFVIIPVNEHAHWYLVIICFPGLVGFGESNTFEFRGKSSIIQPCILIFDSLSTSRKARVVQILRSYLASEFEAKFGETKSFSNEELKVIYPNAPSQKNATDCGLFVLQYVESFFKTPTISTDTSIKKWFKDSVIVRKRKEIADLIENLTNKLYPERTIEFPQLKFPFVPIEDSSSDEERTRNVTIRRKRAFLKTPTKSPLDIEVIPSSSRSTRSSNASLSPSIYSPPKRNPYSTASVKKRKSLIKSSAISDCSSLDNGWTSRIEVDSPPKVKKKLVRRNRRIISSDEDSDGHCSSPKTEPVIDVEAENIAKYTSRGKLSPINVEDHHKLRSRRTSPVTPCLSRGQKMVDLVGKEAEKKRQASKTFKKEIMKPRGATAADVRESSQPVQVDLEVDFKSTEDFYNIDRLNSEKGLNPMMRYLKFKRTQSKNKQKDEPVDV